MREDHCPGAQTRHRFLSSSVEHEHLGRMLLGLHTDSVQSLVKRLFPIGRKHGKQRCKVHGTNSSAQGRPGLEHNNFSAVSMA